jgi:hypothetical protein
MAGLDPSPPGKPKAKYNGSAPASEDRARRRAGALRSWTEFGASALLAARAARLLDRFGFSWTIAVLPRTARKQGLDFLGFPWILSSESRLCNGLRRIFGGRKFLALFCRWGGGAGTRGRYSYDAETQYGSSSKPNPFSAFLQSIAVDRNPGYPEFIVNQMWACGPCGEIFE